ncbi:MAG: 3-deoxy-7-phosphoheptulonate synthase [Gammaproteobacteria bacterium]|jgi:3-deoxy-7-phosphoheptulonate synthase|nr:3-deoxy-7-phosphoheptulonate synthase [Gammaproteobacteria bacterium]|tara:strand:- start:297 stop:1355 length:1059 start_codon:yes stop_codon:yes gene_type:complete
MTLKTDDLRIIETQELSTPEEVRKELFVNETAAITILNSRKTIENILDEKDDRVFVVVGPCSIHDPVAAIEYAKKLKEISKKVSDNLFLIMRVYFEKPRTTIGWKGLINDPMLDGSFKINEGIRIGRKLLLDIVNLEIPTGTEYLDLISPQYIADIISWGAIGARTTESQCHRELASGLSCPIGFKNGTDGNLQITFDAIKSASGSHHFLSVTTEGKSAIFSTSGNPYCHTILRGGSNKINYDEKSIDEVSVRLDKAGLPQQIVVDCSHANSLKDHKKQMVVVADLANQLKNGEKRIKGLMIESNLVEGNQNINDDKLIYGKSVTDACIGWEDTEKALYTLSEAIEKRKSNA